MKSWHSLLKKDSMIRWLESLDPDGISESVLREAMRDERDALLERARALEEHMSWVPLMDSVSSCFINSFMRIDASSLRYANVYECLLLPRSLKSYKSILKKGMNYPMSIQFKDGGKIAAEIGPVSGLNRRALWNCGPDSLADDYYVHPAIPNLNAYVSIKMLSEETDPMRLAELRDEALLIVEAGLGISLVPADVVSEPRNDYIWAGANVLCRVLGTLDPIAVEELISAYYSRSPVLGCAACIRAIERFVPDAADTARLTEALYLRADPQALCEMLKEAGFSCAGENVGIFAELAGIAARVKAGCSCRFGEMPSMSPAEADGLLPALRLTAYGLITGKRPIMVYPDQRRWYQG